MPEPVSWADGVGKGRRLNVPTGMFNRLFFIGVSSEAEPHLYLGQFCAKCHLVSFQIS